MRVSAYHCDGYNRVYCAACLFSAAEISHPAIAIGGAVDSHVKTTTKLRANDGSERLGQQDLERTDHSGRDDILLRLFSVFMSLMTVAEPFADLCNRQERWCQPSTTHHTADPSFFL